MGIVVLTTEGSIEATHDLSQGMDYDGSTRATSRTDWDSEHDV